MNVVFSWPGKNDDLIANEQRLAMLRSRRVVFNLTYDLLEQRRIGDILVA